MIEIYHGDGKGKTTAAVGLAVRAAGRGVPVIFVQFLKNDESGEITILKKIPGITVLHSDCFFGFVRNMTEEQKCETGIAYRNLILSVDAFLQNFCGMKKNINSDITALVVLDEVLHACNNGLLDEQLLIEEIENWKNKFALTEKNGGIEVVLTGRNPSAALSGRADYITEMKKEKHPFDKGIFARTGIEM